MKDPYKVLGVSKNASDDEIKKAYRELVKKYHPDNYDANNPLRDLANEKMQEINEAYDKIQELRSKSKNSSQNSYNYGFEDDFSQQSSSSEVYADVRRLINDRKFTDAEKTLTAVDKSERTAEWHYLASVLLMHRNRQNDAMRELEIACNMDPYNTEYQRAKEMFNNSARGYGSTYNNNSGTRPRSSTDDACNCCANLICLDCLCECLGGDFISCI